jgi:cell division septation protein DedD
MTEQSENQPATETTVTVETTTPAEPAVVEVHPAEQVAADAAVQAHPSQHVEVQPKRRGDGQDVYVK